MDTTDDPPPITDDPSPITVDQVRAHALATTGLTPAEFDYALAFGGGPAREALNSACYALASQRLGESSAADRLLAADALRDRLVPELAEMCVTARSRQYTGWSNQSTGRIRYAEDPVDVAEQAAELAAHALRDRVGGLRHHQEHASMDGLLLRFRWRETVEVGVGLAPDGPAERHVATVVELASHAQRDSDRTTALPPGAPGLRWWTHGDPRELRPYRIDVVADDDLATAVQLLLGTATAALHGTLPPASRA